MSGRTFTLPVTVLINVLASQGMRGRLRAHLSSLKLTNQTVKQPLLAEIDLCGDRLSYLISRADGTPLLSGKQAQAAIPTEELEWHFDPVSTEVVPDRREDWKSSPVLVPHRRVAAPHPNWTRKQRQTFALVDGRRTIAEIAVLLNSPFPEIERVLRELEPTFITWNDLS